MADFKSKNNFWPAVFALVGTTIGAGIFGLPYVFSKTGFIAGLFEMIILVGIILLIQQILGEIALRTRGRKRFIGYVYEYLNGGWHPWVWASVIFGSVGVILVYIILGGKFLSTILGGGELAGASVFFAVWFLAILARPRFFGRTEFYISFFVIMIIILISLLSVGYIDYDNFKNFDWKNLLLPYGVILFAISGYTVIPEMEDILGGEKRKLSRAITAGTLIPPVVYIVFIFIVVGVSGALTSPDAVSGLASALNSQIILYAGSLMGLLAVSGAALSYGVYAKETLWYDLKLNKWLAWILTGFVPFTFFLLGARNPIAIIGLVGAIAFAFQAVVILKMHRRAKLSGTEPEFKINLPGPVYYIIGAAAVLGAALEIWYYFK